jgi:hypothetical protein
MNTIHAAHSAAEFPALIGQRVARLFAALLGRSRTAARAQTQAITLDRAQTVWVNRPLGRVVACDEGQLWLAFDNDPQDVVLLAGQSHQCATGARLSVHAMRPSKYRLL